MSKRIKQTAWGEVAEIHRETFRGVKIVVSSVKRIHSAPHDSDPETCGFLEVDHATQVDQEELHDFGTLIKNRR